MRVIVCGVLTGLNKGAFYDCSSLTSVTIGNGVTSIGYNAFDDCSSLTNVTFGGTCEQLHDAVSAVEYGKLYSVFYRTQVHEIKCSDGSVNIYG